MEIAIYQTVKKLGVSKAYITDVAEKVYKHLKKNGEMSIHFVGDKRIQTVNKAYRGKDTPTDVLSFAYNEGTQIAESDGCGDIFLAVPYITRQAKRCRVPYKEELTRMLIHGILHVCGYDHMTKKEAKDMFTLQEKLLKQCLKRPPVGTAAFVE